MFRIIIVLIVVSLISGVIGYFLGESQDRDDPEEYEVWINADLTSPKRSFDILPFDDVRFQLWHEPYRDMHYEVRWDFQDNQNFSYGQQVQHTFGKPGIYNVISIVDWENGEKDYATRQIIVHDYPVIDIGLIDKNLTVMSDIKDMGKAMELEEVEFHLEVLRDSPYGSRYGKMVIDDEGDLDGNGLISKGDVIPLGEFPSGVGNLSIMTNAPHFPVLVRNTHFNLTHSWDLSGNDGRTFMIYLNDTSFSFARIMRYAEIFIDGDFFIRAPITYHSISFAPLLDFGEHEITIIPEGEEKKISTIMIVPDGNQGYIEFII